MAEPKPFDDFTKNYPGVAEGYEQLSGACHRAGPLSERERILVKLGISIGAGLEGAVHAQVRKALASGLSPDDIRHAVLMALTTKGFPSMMAAMTWVDDLLDS